MSHRVWGVMMAAVVFAGNVEAVNGVAVSVAWRKADLNWGAFYSACPDQNMYDFTERGSLVRFRIAGASVTCDTIHSRTNGFAQCPSLNLQGTKVAFFRYGRRLGKSPTSGRDTILDQGAPAHLSVVNIDGTGLRDLCQVRAATSIDFYDMTEWPAGDWIYYLNPNSAGPYRSNDLCRVNIVTGENQSPYLSLNDGRNPMPGESFVGRFNLSLKADRMGITCYNYDNKYSGVFGFPIAGGNIKTCNCFVGSQGACNPAVSASGSYTSGYGGGWHEVVEIGKLSGGVGPTPNFSSGLSTQYGISITDVQNWTNHWGNGPYPLGADVIRWAVNSDKWVLQQYGWHGESMNEGSEQVLINWVDREAVVTSRNPYVPRDPVGGGGGTIFYGNCVGDFWVDGGAANAGKCEGADGVWRAVDGVSAVGTRRQSGRIPQPTIQLTSDGLKVAAGAVSWLGVTAVDMAGRTVISRAAGRGGLVIDRRLLPRGAFAVRTSSGGVTYTHTVLAE